MDANKVAMKAILVTLGAAFVLLSVIEWKKLADQIPSDNGTFSFNAVPSADMPNGLVCQAVAIPQAKGATLSACQAAVGSNVPWTQGIKAFVYSWIGIGLLVAAFIKPKGAGVSGGGYW